MSIDEWKDGELIVLDKLPVGKKGDLFLFGDPAGFVPEDATMICFTKPRKKLLQQIIKYTYAYRLYYMLN